MLDMFVLLNLTVFIQEVLDRHVGNAKCQNWRNLAERALVGFGSNPLPHGRADGSGGWWGAMQPLTEWEKHLASVSSSNRAIGQSG